MNMKEKPILTVRPKFDSTYTMMQSIPVALLGMVAGAFIGGVFFSIVFSVLGITKFVSIGSIFLGCALLGFFTAPTVFYEMKRKAYHRTIYNFYKDRVEFQKFFWLIQRKRGRVRYSDISDLLQESGFFQQQRNLLTVLLFSPGSGFEDQNRFPGVKLDDLSSKNRMGSKIQTILDNYNNQGMQKAEQEENSDIDEQRVASKSESPAKTGGEAQEEAGL